MIHTVVRITLVALTVLVGFAAPVFAVGPTVDALCTAFWNPVTTDVQGNALPAGVGVTYNLYITKGVLGVPVPFSFGIAGVRASMCSVLTDGQYTAWVSAVIIWPGLGPREGPLSAPFPFVLQIWPVPPVPPSGFTVQ